jgi:RNA polymerase sigma-70 factor, ECF subfamily
MTSRPAVASSVHESPAGLRVDPSIEQVFELVYRQMRSLVAGKDRDLDDLVQDAMEQALKSLPSFEGRSKLSTWTFQVCYRTLLKRRRSWGRWFRRFSFSSTGELPEPPQVPTTEPTLRKERLQRLQGALAQLPDKKRSVVLLHDLEGHSSEEIAEIVGAKLGTVRSRLRDGRRELLSLLEADPYFGSRPLEGE